MTEVTKTRSPYAGMSAKVIRSLAATEQPKAEKFGAMLAYAQAQREKFASAGKSASKLKLWDRAIADVTARLQALVPGASTPTYATFVAKPLPKVPGKAKSKKPAGAKPKALGLRELVEQTGMTREQLLIALARDI